MSRLATTPRPAAPHTHDRLKNNPKLQKLREVLLEHFERRRACDKNAASAAADDDDTAAAAAADDDDTAAQQEQQQRQLQTSTRAIVFSQFRDSVGEIEQALQNVSPLIRPRHFVGQGRGAAATTKASTKGKSNNGDDTTNGKKDAISNNNTQIRGMKQEEQKRVIQDFRAGTYNVLVCTCIGEEGLDIGEVDLIVNFDCLSSPIRMIQRVGRTGRKRNGASMYKRV